MTYTEWIKNHPSVTCEKATEDMLKTFPHLKRVRGHYHCWIWGKREHW